MDEKYEIDLHITAGLAFTVALLRTFEEKLDLLDKLCGKPSRTETPWTEWLLCPGCDHRLNPEDLLSCVPDHYERIIQNYGAKLSPRMRPILRAMVYHKSVCPEKA